MNPHRRIVERGGTCHEICLWQTNTTNTFAAGESTKGRGHSFQVIVVVKEALKPSINYSSVTPEIPFVKNAIDLTTR